MVREKQDVVVVNMDPVMHDIQAYETSQLGPRVLFNVPLPMNPQHPRDLPKKMSTSMRQRRFRPSAQGLTLILAFVLGGWTGPNVLTLFNPASSVPTSPNQPSSTSSLPSRATLTMGKHCIRHAPVAPSSATRATSGRRAAPGFEI